MYTGKMLFAQIMDFLPWKTFHRLVSRYDGDHRIRTLPCADHFRTLAFAQLTYRESLRDIEACLSAQSAKLFHMGIGSPIKRSTLADANERRDWRIYAEFAQRQTRHRFARVCTTADHASSKSLCQGGSWAGPDEHGLCVGLHHNRSQIGRAHV